MRAPSPPDRAYDQPLGAALGCTDAEVTALHVGYLAGAGILVAHVGAVTGWLPPLRGHTCQVALLAAGYFGALTRRTMRTAPEAHGYLSHLQRLLGTFGLFAAVELLSSAAPLAAAFLAAVFPPVAFLLLFPWLVAWPLAAWVAWRLVVGYRRLIRREPLGGAPTDGVRNWGIYQQEAILPVMPPPPPRAQRGRSHGRTPT